MMPQTTIFSLRAALVWFCIGITIGAVMMIDIAVGLPAVDIDLLQTHIHVMLFGWLVQIIFAVGYWMLPRFGRDRPRAGLAVAGILGVNLASVVSLSAPWFDVMGFVWGLEVAALVLFAAHAWPRVKGFGVA